MDPVAFRERNIIRPGDPMIVPRWRRGGPLVASYGLDQCLDVVEVGGWPKAPEPAPPGHGSSARAWRSMIATGPPGGHFADARVTLRADGRYELAVGTAEFGNGTTTVHRADRRDRARHHRRPDPIRQSDTDAGGHDTGAFASTGTVVAGQAVLRACQALRERLIRRSPPASGGAPRCGWTPKPWRRGHPADAERPCRLASAQAAGSESPPTRHGGTPRSVAFNVQWFRVAVDPRTGEIRILRSVHAADAGKVMNPMQCRGQVEGGVAQALGAAMFENVRVDRSGRVTNAAFRQYHLPAFADVPRTEVHFANTADASARSAPSR